MASTRRRASTVPTTIELAVERLINGSEALARAPDGRVVFIAGALPGERVLGEVVEWRRDYARAHLRQICDPPGSSPERRTAPCPVVSQCGGCSWQHLDYAAQLRHAEEVVLRELWRQGRISPARVLPVAAGPEWRSRSRIRLAVDRHRDPRSLRLGFRSRASHRIVPIEDCLVAHAALVAALPLAHAFARMVPEISEIELLVDDRAALRLRGFAGRSAQRGEAVVAVFEELQREARGHELYGARLAGLSLGPSSEAESQAPWRAIAGDVEQRLEVQPGLWLRAPLGVFTQVNLALNRELVAEVLRCAGTARVVTDLYAGCGNFSIPLALAGATVHAVEQSALAVRAGTASAEEHGVAMRCHFEASAVERALRPELLAPPVEVVVLDPPRSGAAAAVAAIAISPPERVIYVSCDLGSFARDAATLCKAGLRLEMIRVLDLTPQTHRAEVLGVFG